MIRFTGGLRIDVVKTGRAALGPGGSVKTEYEKECEMKIKNLVGMAGLIVLAGACVPSVNPFYTEKDVVFDARLVGEWRTTSDPNDIQTWKFEKSGDNAYKLVVAGKDGKHDDLDARLFKLKDQLFLDVIPTECRYAPDEGGIVSAAMFAGHLLLRVPQLEPSLRLAGCNYDWLTKHLEAHPNDLTHHNEDKAMLLTAQTKDLQAFVLQHLGDLFGSPEELSRVTAK
jgi:hypothetical protein